MRGYGGVRLVLGAPRLYLSSSLLLLRMFLSACFRDVVVVAYGCLAIAPPFQLRPSQHPFQCNCAIFGALVLLWFVARWPFQHARQSRLFAQCCLHTISSSWLSDSFTGPCACAHGVCCTAAAVDDSQERRQWYSGVHMSLRSSDVCSFGLGCCVQSCVRRDSGNHLFRTFVLVLHLVSLVRKAGRFGRTAGSGDICAV